MTGSVDRERRIKALEAEVVRLKARLDKLEKSAVDLPSRTFEDYLRGSS